MLAEEKAAASRFFAIMAGLIGAAGVVVTVWMLAQNGGMFPGLKPWLAALAHRGQCTVPALRGGLLAPRASRRARAG